MSGLAEKTGLSQNGTLGLLMTAVFSRKNYVSKSQNIYIERL
jgi:predicted nucleic acid-binding protein